MPNNKAAAEAARRKERTENVTRVLAIILAAVSVFIWFFKLLFF